MAGCNAVAFASVPPDRGNDDVMTAIRGFQDCWNEMVRTADGWKLSHDDGHAAECDAGN